MAWQLQRKPINVRAVPTDLQARMNEAEQAGGGISVNSHPEFADIHAGFQNPLHSLFVKKTPKAAPTMSAEDTSYIEQGRKAHYDAMAKIAMNRRARGNG